MKSRLLLASFCLAFTTAKAAYVPVTISSGFNADVIANGIGSGLTTTGNDVDGVNYCFVSNGWQATSSSTACSTGLPASGVINSAVTAGLSYQLASYSDNNDLRLPTNNAPGTLTFQTPMTAQNLYILAVTGSGSSNMTVQVNFTDATNQVSSSISVADWYGGTSVAITGFQRMNRNTNALDNSIFAPVGPNMYQYTVAILAANQSKQIASVQFTRTTGTGATTLNIFAITAETVVTCAAPTAPTASSITPTTASLNWTQTGTPSQWQIKYGAPGFNPNTAGTSIFTSTKPYTLNPPLTASTSYEYYVRAVCGPNDTSLWSPVVAFTTTCNAPSVVSKKDSFNCGTGTVILEATTSAGASIKWYANLTGGTALATGNSFTTPSISATTTYYIAAAQGTCESSPRQAVVATIRTPPTVNIGNDTSICPGVSYVLDATTTNATYAWNTGATTASITVSTAGTYSVLVTVNGCGGSDARTIANGIVPTANLPAITDLCSGETATLNAGNTGSTYLWTPGSATTQLLNVTTGGTYTVQVKSVDGCKTNSSTNVIIRPLPVPALGADTSICEGAQITLDAGNPGYAYLWNTTATTQTINVTDSGTYTVTVTTPYNCVNTEDKHVAFLPSPRVEGFNFIPMFYDELGKVKFSPLNPTNVSSYEWDFGDGTPTTTLMNPVHVYAASGDYTVKLHVYNGCSDYETSQPINVDLPTGIVVLGKDKVNVMLYPNPAKDLVIIENKSADVKLQEITLFNMLGEVVYRQKATGSALQQVPVSHLASGLYSVRILTDKGFVIRKFEVMK